MGLFNDNVSPQRNEWQYEYTGQELLGKAKMLAERHDALEKAARNKTADLLRDCSVSQSDPRFGELKREISTHGSIREQCQVFAHEFARTPARVFQLGLGDVTFFELVEPT